MVDRSRVQAVFVDLDDTLYDFRADIERTVRELHRSFPEILGGVEEDALVSRYWGVLDEVDRTLAWAMLLEDHRQYRRMLLEALLEGLRVDGLAGGAPGDTGGGQGSGAGGGAEDGGPYDGLEPADGHPGDAPLLARAFGRIRQEGITPYEGALDTLRDLSSRYKVGLITNGPSALQREKIQGLGLDDLLPADLVLVTQEVGHWKPDPPIFQEAAKRAGVPHEGCVMIGDGLDYDVPAKALGWQAVWFNAIGQEEPGSFDELEHAPDAVARDWAGVRRVLLG